MQFRSISPSHLRFVLLFFSLLALSPTPAQAQIASRSFTLAPPPAWTSYEALTPPSSEQRAEAREGVVYLLSDQQVRVVGPTVERYFRHARQIVAQPGIEHAAQLELEFDPTYQQLIIHRMQIRRGQQTLNALRPAEIRLLQKEDESEQRLFNGTLAALAILNDVRVGDVIEYDYSVNGQNPILGGRFADVSYLAEAEPVVRLRYRLLWHAARVLQHQTQNLDLQPQVRQLGELTEYTWERANAPAPELEYSAAAPADELPALHLTEFKDWAAVAAWAAPLYRVNGGLSPALQQQLDAWRQMSPLAEDRLLIALRFVQDEIRYLGIEMGPHSHLPHQPAQVLARRYGDCKDKALLLATALQALGIEAYPALVNSDLLGRVAQLPPSPFSFDHVITQVKLNGQTYWFDPTVSLQRGALKQRYNPEFGQALVVRDGVKELEELPLALPAEPLKTVREVFTVNQDNQTATLTVTITYRGIDADAARAYMAQNSLKELAKEHLNDLTLRDRSVSAEGSPQVEDETANNVIALTEHYRINRFWRGGARRFQADRITQELPILNRVSQKQVRLTFPLDVEHQIEIHAPTAAALGHATASVKHAALQFDFRRVQERQAVKLVYRLRALRPFVGAEESQALATAIEQIEDASEFQLTNETGGNGWRLLGVFVLLMLPLAVLRLARARRAKRAAPLAEEPRLSPVLGSEPAAPLRLADETALDERVQMMRCLCGANYQSALAARKQETVIYDGKRLALLQLSCAICGQTRDIYFDYS